MRKRPNGLAFSCRERAWASLQKTNDLAREAVCCDAGLGRRLPRAAFPRLCSP
jgi:hypothetical protein